MQEPLKLIMITMIFNVMLFKSAYAYIDPGSVSIILQVIASVFVGIIVFFRTIKLYIFNLYIKFTKYIFK